MARVLTWYSLESLTYSWVHLYPKSYPHTDICTHPYAYTQLYASTHMWLHRHTHTATTIYLNAYARISYMCTYLIRIAVMHAVSHASHALTQGGIVHKYHISARESHRMIRDGLIHSMKSAEKYFDVTALAL